MLLAVLCAVTVAGADGLCRRALLQAGDGADYPGRCGLWRPGRGFPVRGHEPVCRLTLGQDAWAPWQVFAGLAGLLAG